MYPETAAERDHWIVERRGPREPLNPEEPYAFLLEEERFHTGELGTVATIFLTNRECPFRCAMCDLWRYTLPHSVAPGAIPRQIAHALAQLGQQAGKQAPRQIKLYNAGSFFDAAAIPREDHAAIAELVRPFERVVVECHPTLVRDDCFRFAESIEGTLEVAMGLETAHPEVLAKLNKRMTLDSYAQAASRLTRNGIALRSFILVQPPFLPADEAVYWACRSIEFAIACGATAITLIPTRGGNGAMEAFTESGVFAPPLLAAVEDAHDFGISLGRARVFADTWDLAPFASCSGCAEQRVARITHMNHSQTVLPRIACARCGASA